MANGANGQREPGWFWKAATGTLLALFGAVMLKGCDEWQKTTTALQGLTAEVRYQAQRSAESEAKLNMVSNNLQLLYERTVARFDERRKEADELVNRIDERLDRLERYDSNNLSPPQPRR